VTFSLLSYALVDRRYDAASAGNPKGSPPSLSSRLNHPPRSDTAHVPAGTSIHIRLKEAIRTEGEVPEERFTAVLYGPLIVGNRFLAPSRSKIIGQLTEGRGPNGAEGHALVLRKLLVNGREYDLITEPVTLVSTGRGLPITGNIHTLETQFTFRLSSPLELPVIRMLERRK